MTQWLRDGSWAKGGRPRPRRGATCAAVTGLAATALLGVFTAHALASDGLGNIGQLPTGATLSTPVTTATVALPPLGGQGGSDGPASGSGGPTGGIVSTAESVVSGGTGAVSSTGGSGASVPAGGSPLQAATGEVQSPSASESSRARSRNHAKDRYRGKPRVHRLRATPTRFHNRGPGPRGTLVSFWLSSPAVVQFLVFGPAPGCPLAARFTVHGDRGLNRVRFRARPQGDPLRSGRYRVTVQAMRGRMRSSVREVNVAVVPPGSPVGMRPVDTVCGAAAQAAIRAFVGAMRSEARPADSGVEPSEAVAGATAEQTASHPKRQETRRPAVLGPAVPPGDTFSGSTLALVLWALAVAATLAVAYRDMRRR